MRIEITTVRGGRMTAYTVALALLSFLLMQFHLCGPASADRDHAAEAPLPAAAEHHSPTDHCHHNETNPQADELARVLPREGTAHLTPSASGILIDQAAATRNVLSGSTAALRPGTDGPPSPGRLLLITLGVARS